MKLTINITKAVLKQSKDCISDVGQTCAIGQAVWNLFGKHIWVSHHCIHYYKSGFTGETISDFQIPLPSEATAFICQFDRASPRQREFMPELSFDIDVPEEIISAIGIDEVHKVLSESETLSISEKVS